MLKIGGLILTLRHCLEYPEYFGLWIKLCWLLLRTSVCSFFSYFFYLMIGLTYLLLRPFSLVLLKLLLHELQLLLDALIQVVSSLVDLLIGFILFFFRAAIDWSHARLGWLLNVDSDWYLFSRDLVL